MKKLFVLIVILLIWGEIAPISAKNPQHNPLAYQGFSGGMFLHMGYVWGGQTTLQTPQGTMFPTQKVAGIVNGIGGGLRLHFGDHFRIGTEGYGTYLGYGDHSSKFSIGWGGILFDYIFHTGRLHPYIGITLGGGSATNLTLMAPTTSDFITEQNTSHRKYAFAAVTPFIGVEYALTSRMRLVVKTDWLLNVSNPQADFPTGPRLYLGFSFYHMKK